MSRERRLWKALIGFAFGVWLAAGTAVAGSLVEFSNVSDQKPARLSGYLARPDSGLALVLGRHPDGAGPFPAVVVLHGCSGISSHSIGIADRLSSWGYVALTVDTLGPRGIATHCRVGGSYGGFIDEAFDAYAALRYLSHLDFVDPARVAVLGQSMGGSAVLYAIDRLLAAHYFQERFRAAVAYYPGCSLIGDAADMTSPTLILIGESDDWNPAAPCRDMVARSRPGGAPIALSVYPGAFHGFDVPYLQPGRRSLGHWLEYNAPAAKDAEEKVYAFLAAHLRGPAGEPAEK